MTKGIGFRGAVFSRGGKAGKQAPGLGISMCRLDVFQKAPCLADEPMSEGGRRNDAAAFVGNFTLLRNQPDELRDLAPLACRPGGPESRGDIFMRHGAEGRLQSLGDLARLPAGVQNIGKRQRCRPEFRPGGKS